MTPERLAKIRDILRAPGLYWEREITDAGRELLAHLDTLTTERNALLDRVDKLFAATREQRERREEVDELAATIANERGEGEPPGEWWTFTDLAWRHRIGVVWHASPGRWVWSVHLNSGDTLDGRARTAREGMRVCMAERARLDALEVSRGD